MHPYAERLLRNRGVDVTGWLSHRVHPESVDRADLVVTATQRQRDQVASLRPAAMSRVFGLFQLARWAEAARTADPVNPADFGAWLAESARSVRSHTQPSRSDRRDLADPNGHSYRQFVRCADLVDLAWKSILGAAPLTGAVARPSN